MACTTSIHTELPDVDAPPLMLDPAALSIVEPGVWLWHIVVFLGTGADAWLLDLTAGQFGAVWPVHAKPGPVVRGPDGFDVVFENDRPFLAENPTSRSQMVGRTHRAFRDSRCSATSFRVDRVVTYWMNRCLEVTRLTSRSRFS
jgi:hypothetical protein